VTSVERVCKTNLQPIPAVFSRSGKTVNARHEKSDDGKNWALWMDVTLTRDG
jgi:hypothetical protein